MEAQVQEESPNEQFLHALEEMKGFMDQRLIEIKEEEFQQRQQYMKTDYQKYKEYIQEVSMQSKNKIESVAKEWLDLNEYTMEDFSLLVLNFKGDQAIANALAGIFTESLPFDTQVPETLNEELYQQILIFQCERLEELSQVEGGKGNESLAICTAMIEDEIFNKWGYKPDEIRAAMKQYLTENKYPEIQEKMKKATVRVILG